VAIRHLFSFLLVSTLFVGLTSPIWATNPSSGPEDADLFKGESVDLYFYHNQFFSFDMMVAGDWHVLSSKELIQQLRKHQRRDDFSDQNIRESGLFFLLSISKYETAKPGPRGEFNPHIMLGAMDLSNHPGIKTGKDYIRFLATSGIDMGAKLTLNPSLVQLGGVDFWRLHGRARRGSEAINCEWIGTVRKGYGLHFQLMAGSKTEMTELEDILKSLHFD